MSELILVRGVPGSGKSTFARAFRDDDIRHGMSSIVLEADLWMTDEEGRYKFDGTRLKECHQKCQQAVCGHMMLGTERIYVANTFIRKWEADAYYALAKVWGYDVKVYRLEGNFENVHGVPADKVAIMRANMEVYEGENYR